MAIRNMLPLAPGTRPEVLARRGNSMRRSLHDLVHETRHHPLPPPPIPNDPRHHALPWNPPEHVDPPVLEVGKTIAKRAYLIKEGQIGKFKRLVVGLYGGHLSILAEVRRESVRSH